MKDWLIVFIDANLEIITVQAFNIKEAIILNGIDVNSMRLRQLKREIIEYLNEESVGIDDQKPWLGCSDIIESIFGKYKNFSARTPTKEVGKAVLTIPVFTSEISLEEVEMAVKEVSTQDVNNWLNINIGDTLFTKRKRAYNGTNEATKSSVMKL